MNRAISALGVMAALALVVGCTTTSVGDPRPEETSNGSSDPSGPAESGDLPPRPREIQLDDVDPCTLIPQADESEYYIERARRGR